MTMWGLADLLINTHKPWREDAWLESMRSSRGVYDEQFQSKRRTPTAHITRSNLLLKQSARRRRRACWKAGQLAAFSDEGRSIVAAVGKYVAYRE